MKKIKYLGVFALCLLVCGCSQIPKTEDGKELVVSMDGLSMTVDDFYDKLKDNYGTYELINQIDDMLLNSVYETTEDMETEVESNVSTMKSYYGDNFEDMIYSYYGVSTEDALRDLILLSLKREKAMLDYAKTLVTDDDINEYYENTIIGDIRASHILITPEVTDDMTDEEKTAKEEEALNKAKEIITRLDNGEDFATLANELSEDSAAGDGGDLDYFNRGDMVSEFEDAVVALEVNKYTTEPVKTEYGYHIILKTDQKEKPELSEVKEDIIDTLANDLVDNTSNISAYALEWLRNEHNLEIYDSELKESYEHYMNKQKTTE